MRRRGRGGRLLGRLMLAAVALLVVLAGAAAAALAFGQDAIKGRLVEAVRARTGRTLVLGGPVEVWPGATLLLAVNDVSLADVGRVGRIEARVAWLPLFGRTVEIERLLVDRADLEVKPAAPRPARPVGPAGANTPAQSRSGWTLRLGEAVVTQGRVVRDGRAVEVPLLSVGPIGEATPTRISGDVRTPAVGVHVAGTVGPAAADAMPGHLVLTADAVRVNLDGNLDPYGSGETRIEATAPDAAAHGLHDLRLVARVAFAAGMPRLIEAVLHVGGSDLAPGGVPIRLDRLDVTATGAGEGLVVEGIAQAAGAVAELHGKIAATTTLSGVEASLTARVPDLAALSPGAGLPRLTDVAFAARLDRGAGGEGLAAHAIRLTLPQGDLGGEISVAFGARPRLDADLSSTRLDIDALRALLPQPPAAAAPATGAAVPPPPPDARVIPDRPLPWAALDRADGDVRLTVGEALVGGVTLRDVIAHAALRDGRLALDPAGVRVGEGRLDLSVQADAHAAEPTLAVTAHGAGVRLQPFLAAAIGPDELNAAADVLIDLRAHGASAHALAASLTGRAAVALADGDVDNRVLTALLAPALRAARLPIEFGPGRTAVRCLAANLVATAGDVVVGTLLLDTARLAVQASGDVNLGPELIGLRVRPTARVAGGIAVPLRIGGTLRDPKVTLDAGLALGALLAGDRRTDGCPAALASARAP